jgi:CMP-N-acetylneuraminic acid synthetase
MWLSFLTLESIGYLMSMERSVDIDLPVDRKWADFLVKDRDYE